MSGMCARVRDEGEDDNVGRSSYSVFIVPRSGCLQQVVIDDKGQVSWKNATRLVHNVLLSRLKLPIHCHCDNTGQLKIIPRDSFSY